MRNLIFCICTAISFGVMFLGCQAPEDNSKIFRMNLPFTLATLDPAFAKDQATVWMCSQLFDGLVSLNDSLQIQPALAKTWQISPDGLRYRFTLRKAYFHSNSTFKGRIVRARDVVFSFQRICDPKVASPGFWIFNEKIEGLSNFRAGNCDSIAGFSVINDSTIEIRLTKVFSPFLSLLSLPYLSIVPEDYVQQVGKSFGQNPIGTGAFRFQSWQEGRQLILLKNNDYFEPGLPKLEAIQVFFIRNKLTAFTQFLQGNLDFINGLDASYKDEILTSEGKLKPQYQSKFRLEICPQLNTEYIGFLSDIFPAIQNPLIRQALSLAIPRKDLIRFWQNGIGFPGTNSILPPSLRKWAIDSLGYYPDSAKKLLTKAGYSPQNPLPTLVFYTNPSYLPLAEYLQKQWEQIGIPIKIEVLEGASLRSSVSKGKIAAWRASWMADYPDAENYFSLFLSQNIPPNGPNTTRLDSPVIDSLYFKLLQTTSLMQQTTLQKQIDSAIQANANIIVLYYDAVIRLTSHSVQNFSPDAMNRLQLKFAYKKNMQN